jgi:hypothetical protein
MLVPQGWPWDSPRSGEGRDSFPVGGVGEADAVAGGDEDVGVVHEPVDVLVGYHSRPWGPIHLTALST